MAVADILRNRNTNQLPSLERRDNRVGIYFLLPAVIVLIIIVAYPVIYSLVMSFHRWRPTDINRNFVGFDNFARVVTDSRFPQSIFNTFVYAIVGACFKVIIGMILALMMNREFKGRSIARV